MKSPVCVRSNWTKASPADCSASCRNSCLLARRCSSARSASRRIDATARLQVGTIVATEVPEADTKPIATIAFDVAGPATKVEAQIVISAEAVRSFEAATQDGIRQVLVSACATATWGSPD